MTTSTTTKDRHITDEEFEDYDIPSNLIVNMTFNENFDFINYKLINY